MEIRSVIIAGHKPGKLVIPQYKMDVQENTDKPRIRLPKYDNKGKLAWDSKKFGPYIKSRDGKL